MQLESIEKNHQFMVSSEFTILHITEVNLLRLKKTPHNHFEFFSSDNLSLLTLIDP